MSDEEISKASLRQLPPGELENIRKKFESGGNSQASQENFVNLRAKSSAQQSPVHRRPVSNVFNSPVKNGNMAHVRPKSTLDFIGAPSVSKILDKMEGQGNKPNVSDRPAQRDPSPKPSKPVKPVISKKPSFTKADETDTPLSVVQRRTQKFESSNGSLDKSSPVNKSALPVKPPPPVKPRSRPPSTCTDEADTTVIGQGQMKDNKSNNENRSPLYCDAWDSKKMKISAPSQKKPPPTPPPKKPPRTGAHDDYMRLKVAMGNQSNTTTINTHIYEDVPDEFEKEQDPVYRKIQKEGTSVSNSKESVAFRQNGKSQKPNRPPPPRSRPVTISVDSVESLESPKKKPNVPPHKPKSSPNLRIYEEVEAGDLNLNAIKHWDLPSSPAPPPPPLRRTLSADSLMENPIYNDPALIRSYRDDSDIYIDNTGYAVPNRHRSLDVTTSLDEEALHIGGICRPISQAVMKQLKKLKPVSKPKRSSARENWKKLQNVKMKINIAFAVLRQMKGEHRSESGTESSGEVDSLVDETEIKRRISHCGTVRKNTSKSVRKSRMKQAQSFHQMFDFCLIVGLQANENHTSYKPKVIFKFPDLGRLQIDCEGRLSFCNSRVESNVAIPEFCFPDAEEFDVRTASAAAPSESYSFVLTSGDGERLYGYCRRLVPFSSVDGLPEVMCIVSPVDAFSMYNELLDEVESCRHKSMDLARELLSASFGRPLPDPGGLVHVRTLDENWDTGTILLTRPADSRVDNVNREYLLSKLGVDKLLKLFSCILLERSILFCAKSLSILSQTIHALVSLLYPFRWQHTYIPVLPESMLDVCCSPTPYIIGILSSQLSYVQQLPISEIVIFDLNKKQLIKSQGDEGTILPKDIQKALRTALNMCKADTEVKSSSNLMISETFLRMFVEAVGHYGEHITTQQDGQRVFLKENFIQNAQSESMMQFLQWFCETQMFDVFVTEQVEKPKSYKNKSKTIELFNQRIMESRRENADKIMKKNKGLLKMLKA